MTACWGGKLSVLCLGIFVLCFYCEVSVSLGREAAFPVLLVYSTSVNILPACLSVYHMHRGQKRELEFQMVVNTRVGAGNLPLEGSLSLLSFT